MMFQIAYVPIGVPTFHLDSAGREFDKTRQLLSSISDECVFPEKMLLSVHDLAEFLDGIHPDLIIIQNVTFANASYVSEILRRFTVPILLWTLREPVIDGGRLRLNSLTGAYSAANTIRAYQNREFDYVFGAPEEDVVKQKLAAVIRAARVRLQLRNLNMAAIGQTPQGFGFGRAMDTELLQKFGITLEAMEARELIDRARRYSDQECAAELEEAGRIMEGLEKVPETNRKDFARLYKAYKDYVTENHIGAIASRCWPDFFTSFGTPVCSVLAMLNTFGVAASCETDVYGALSMYIGMELSGQAVFFGDPVSVEEKENTITFWHCGMAACSLAREDTGAQVGVHPNRRIGPVMDFGCRACEKVTVFRVGRLPDGHFRFFIAQGEALDKSKQFSGTSIVVRLVNEAGAVVEKSVLDGWEPHFVVIYGDVAAELAALGRMLDINVCQY